jgi:succinyl-diaminopimelate desuccinylase
LSYYTDGAVIIPALKVPFIIFGPGDPGQAHCPNETINIADMLRSSDIYAEILKKLAFE